MRYALGIEYDGCCFNGWQFQPNEPSVQACLQDALEKVANHAVTVFCAGRTDTGVHAACQVVHFDSESERSRRQWMLGLNSQLPSSVCVRWVQQVSEDFHARFKAIERSYRYTILNRWAKPALRDGRVAWCRKPLDVAQMDLAARSLLGEHDFSAFRSAGCKARHAVREVTTIAVSRVDDDVNIDITANGFLYHMVRNIAGSLMVIGKGEQPAEWMTELLNGKDRTRAGMTAEASGLYFMCVRYPESFKIPDVLEAFPDNGGIYERS